MKNTLRIVVYMLMSSMLIPCFAQKKPPIKPRILISSDIGGTDPDDNQSMAHLLMYSEQFDIEGLVSSPSFGNGSKKEILRMIDLYQKDLPQLTKHVEELLSADYLRSICKQGNPSTAPLKGYSQATEGSDWIIHCARKKDNRPLWILVWGAMDDLAQALHDAPDIVPNIRIYWIGGPNKKWGVNSYDYIVRNFSDLWIIENNASYRGFIADTKKKDPFNADYYAEYIENHGNLGRDFMKYYDGVPKMGDSPSLFYMMDGNPENPVKESWGGSFECITHSAHRVFTRNTTLNDTVPVYSVIDFYFNGPVQNAQILDSAYFTMTIDKQDWKGYYVENGRYLVRYSPKASAILTYNTQSPIKELNHQQGTFVVSNTWPGKVTATDYTLGKNWYSDKQQIIYFEKKWQGAATSSKWRTDILKDWAKRWSWLK